jgi:hypothetical protein
MDPSEVADDVMFRNFDWLRRTEGAWFAALVAVDDESLPRVLEALLLRPCGAERSLPRPVISSVSRY